MDVSQLLKFSADKNCYQYLKKEKMKIRDISKEISKEILLPFLIII